MVVSAPNRIGVLVDPRLPFCRWPRIGLSEPKNWYMISKEKEGYLRELKSTPAREAECVERWSGKTVGSS